MITKFWLRLQHWYYIAIILLSGIIYWYMGYHIVRSNSHALLLGFSLLFLLYGLLIYQKWKGLSVAQYLLVAILLRLILLLAIPNLSEDYARFVWDGKLVAHSLNPYQFLPHQLIETDTAHKIGLTKELFTQLNSPQYFSVYPPVCQAIFGVSAWLAKDNIVLHVIILRLFILLAEVATFYLLFSLLKPKKTTAVLWYAFNPLIIVELTGNLHFEAIMLPFLLGAIYFFKNAKFNTSALFLCFAINTKLLPLIFLPIIVRKLGLKQAILYCFIIFGVSILLWLPFISLSLLKNVWSSVDLYFQKFEFNASIYYLIRQIGYWAKGYNIIQTLGPILSFVTLIGTIWIALRRGSFIEKALWTVTLYFMMATTVHPWYITTLIGLACLTKFYYPIIWSALLPLTYLTYSSMPYQENLWLVAIEYIVVISVMVYEFWYKPISYT